MMLFASILCSRGTSLHPCNPGRQTKPMGQGGSMHGTVLEGSFHALHFEEVSIWYPGARHKSCMQCKNWFTQRENTTLPSLSWLSSHVHGCLSLSLFLSLLALTTHLPLKQGKKLKTHSATLVVGRPAEANFAPREVWISILSYWHCNKVKCIEMISSHTHTHTGHCLLNFLQAKLHWRSWQWQGCRIVPQSMVDPRKLVQFHRWLVT